MKKWILLLAMAAAVWAAGGVTGQWSGTMSLDAGRQDPAYLKLEQNGTKITGTAGPSASKQVQISSGRVENDQITVEMRPGSALLRLVMKLDGAKLSGDVYEDDQRIGTVSLQRVAE